ncbi:hypothetical protein J7T55_003785 [Diaporthe amygdali]|uniref:uncharacterized protein n=1 Tax=Phomopsis amygdali TaxID=1214568 RepID=UPI0022FE53E5|nr:uncharacterized protein J7T55_003785 [Diaporthe amygdali]KAJ0117371.1 hypothetical protein J7T55_003785 [Diaporthe amygdali]
MALPTELIYQIIRDIINTPAVFIFDIDFGKDPHPPLLPQSCHIRFRPVGITVPTVGPDAIVRFNPRQHIICLHRTGSTINQIHATPGPPSSASYFRSWVKRDSDLLTDLNFDIVHLAFMNGLYNLSWPKYFITLHEIFPSLQCVYGAVVELPRKHPSEPVGLVRPVRDPAHTLSPVFMFMTRRAWQIAWRSYSRDILRLTGGWTGAHQAPLLALVRNYEELVLI